MSEIDALYKRNAEFASRFQFSELGLKPELSTVVLTCLDARIDPAHFMGLGLGEALVLRNFGGRVTDEVKRELGFIWTMAGLMSGGAAPDVSLVIVHHDDCGLERVANPQIQEMISERSRIPISTLEELAIFDHQVAFEDDVVRLRESEWVPNELVVSAHFYDPKSGQLKQVIAPAPLVSEGELSC